MSLIEDIRVEMAELDTSPRKLRSFALLMGTVFAVLVLLGMFKHWALPATFCLAAIAILWIAGGWIRPGYLRSSYRLWMRAAAILGWIISRVLLGILFYCVITPTGIIGKLAGKRFLDCAFRSSRKTFWIDRDPDKHPTYDKLH